MIPLSLSAHGIRSIRSRKEMPKQRVCVSSNNGSFALFCAFDKNQAQVAGPEYRKESCEKHFLPLLPLASFRARKFVTRRLGWRFLKPGTRLMGCEECQGLKPGEKLVKLGEIELSALSRKLSEYQGIIYKTKAAMNALEGFPEMTGTILCSCFAFT